MVPRGCESSHHVPPRRLTRSACASARASRPRAQCFRQGIQVARRSRWVRDLLVQTPATSRFGVTTMDRQSVKVEGLRDGTTVVLRQPTLDDLARSMEFYRSLSPEDRRYLRVDVTSREVIERRIKQAIEGDHVRLMALVDDRMVALGILELAHDLWTRDAGEIRVLVARDYRRRGLASLLITDLFIIAQKMNLKRVLVRMAAPQTAIRSVCERLGFHLNAVLPHYIKDADGNDQDLIVMSCTLDEVFRQMKDHDKADDWPDG